MPTTRSDRSPPPRAERSEVETPREIVRDIVDYLTEYARENPGYAALACLGAGFILGWKLKPW
jgi:hypothetical protein